MTTSSESNRTDVTELLVRLRKGEEGIYDKIYPLIYQNLRQLAYAHMSNQSPDHTYSRTELVHEAYLKMINQTRMEASDRNHFLAIASRCMRQILIDYARKKNAKKRGGKQHKLTYLDGILKNQERKTSELIGIDDALNRLEQLNKRLSKVVEMRFFGNMTIPQTADALQVSEATVKRDWKKARGWLYKELKGRYEFE